MPTPFTVDLSDPLNPIIDVDGRNVTTEVAALWIECRPGQTLPTLTVQTTGPGRIEGAGIIQVATETSTTPADVADLIRALDPAQLRTAATAGASLADDVFALTRNAIADLIEKSQW